MKDCLIYIMPRKNTAFLKKIQHIVNKNENFF